MKPQTQARATLIANTITNSDDTPKMAGLAFGSIFSIVLGLLPRLIACFNPSDGREAKDYVARRWNQDNASNQYRGYKKELVKSVTRQALNAARRERQRITFEQAQQIAFATLDNVRLGDQSQASIIIAENHDFTLI